MGFPMMPKPIKPICIGCPPVRPYPELGHFPRRGSVLQPRVAVLGYPGKDGGEFPNPTGVAAESPRVPNRIGLSRIAIGVHGAFDLKPCCNPVGVARIIAAIPKVAEYSNLGLWAAIPGLREAMSCFRPTPKGLRLSPTRSAHPIRSRSVAGSHETHPCF